MQRHVSSRMLQDGYRIQKSGLIPIWAGRNRGRQAVQITAGHPWKKNSNSHFRNSLISERTTSIGVATQTRSSPYPWSRLNKRVCNSSKQQRSVFCVSKPLHMNSWLKFKRRLEQLYSREETQTRSDWPRDLPQRDVVRYAKMSPTRFEAFMNHIRNRALK